jgi:hypothetical protein
MNTRFKVFASYNILQYLCDFYPCSYICNCLKMPKKSQLTNIVSEMFPFSSGGIQLPLKMTTGVVLYTSSIISLWTPTYDSCTSITFLSAADVHEPCNAMSAIPLPMVVLPPSTSPAAIQNQICRGEGQGFSHVIHMHARSQICLYSVRIPRGTWQDSSQLSLLSALW